MHRIDSTGAAVALPTPAAVGSTVGYWTAGNPGSGIPATVLDQDWLNAVQEELLGVLTAAGVTASKTNRGQLLASLYALHPGLNSANRLVANPGYMKLPGGMLLQWIRNKTATTDGAGAAAITWTFPVTFVSSVIAYSYVHTNENTVINTGRVVAYAPTLSSQNIYLSGGVASTTPGAAFSGFILGV